MAKTKCLMCQGTGNGYNTSGSIRDGIIGMVICSYCNGTGQIEQSQRPFKICDDCQVSLEFAPNEAKNRIAELEQQNRDLVEQMNKMAVELQVAEKTAEILFSSNPYESNYMDAENRAKYELGIK